VADCPNNFLALIRRLGSLFPYPFPHFVLTRLASQSVDIRSTGKSTAKSTGMIATRSHPVEDVLVLEQRGSSKRS
jgi:hypothetical protein